VRSAEHGSVVRAPVAVGLVLAILTLFPTGAAGRSPTSRRPACDPIDPTACLLPFPNDFFTVPDPGTATGRRVDFAPSAMPRNNHGIAIDPAEWNRNDGFSPGSPILTHVPGIDLTRTGAAPITDIGRSLRSDAPIVVLNARTLRRQPYWAELDANATDPNRQVLIVRPAVNFDDGARYIVALRRIRDAGGRVIAPGPAFSSLLRGDEPSPRAVHIRRVVSTLARAGVESGDLYLAWDFTVASTSSLTGRLLHIRDDAFRTLGTAAPHFTVTTVEDLSPAQNPRIARHVTGTFDVPSYLDQAGGPPGSRFHYGPRARGLPTHIPGNTQVAPFVCDIPRSATPSHPARPSLYGHGLFSEDSEVFDLNVEAMANEHDFVFCGTEWLGLTGRSPDLAASAKAFADASHFPELADRLQQSVLDALFLGRLLVHPQGFASDPAFRVQGLPAFDPSAGLGYDGNSLGGIMGGVLTAVSQDVHRAVLGVPGINFSTLLNRSTSFPSSLLDTAYPDKLDQQLFFALVQMLWDRADPDGYANHLTADPLPRTPRHRVLLHVAFGDHQVANVASDVEARTIGASIQEPALAAGRSPDRVPYWGIPAIDDPPFAGSAMVVWDSGSPAGPLTNTPPTAGGDPHEDPRNSGVARQQKAVFLTTGNVVDVCHGPCQIPHR
jgi:hypothetical protein